MFGTQIQMMNQNRRKRKILSFTKARSNSNRILQFPPKSNSCISPIILVTTNGKPQKTKEYGVSLVNFNKILHLTFKGGFELRTEHH